MKERFFKIGNKVEREKESWVEKRECEVFNNFSPVLLYTNNFYITAFLIKK